MHQDAARLLRDQAGVLSRRQALGAGLCDVEVRRLVRRREWVAVHPGGCVDHTGSLTLAAARLGRRARHVAGRAEPPVGDPGGEGPGRVVRDGSVMHVVVARHRRLVAPPGVRLHRVARFDDRVQWNLGPPRVRLEEALLDLADESARDLDAIALLADACGSRRTTPRRLVDVLALRPRAHRRAWPSAVLLDVADDLLGAGTRLPDSRGAAPRPVGRASPGRASGRRSAGVPGRGV
ncbi:MAG: hypothetical protein LH468_12290 [Nocardioides sp.]|nr:hypothetical protein [Nocardioides sp.]